jgi:drug/metabolite transporter (DMT)-like permease
MKTSQNFYNIFLYTLCTLIWGSTWFAIKWQIDTASPIASVFWRFALASILLLGLCLITRKKMRFDLGTHFWFMAQGFFLFSVNYILTYTAETLTSSGLIALTFSVLIYYNMFGMRFFFLKPLSKKVIWGSLLGGLGMIFIFMNEILHFDAQSKTMWGLLIGFAATLMASCGNMVAHKTYSLQIPVMVTNAYGMLYGCLSTLIIGFILGVNFSIPMTSTYLGALAYLSVFGSVIAFGAYLSLAGRIGAEKAAYTSVINPVIALIISSFWEEFRWTPYVLIGVVLCLIGNVVTLYRRPIKA